MESERSQLLSTYRHSSFSIREVSLYARQKHALTICKRKLEDGVRLLATSRVCGYSHITFLLYLLIVLV